ncbi:MAG: metallophosphoesterase [Acidobacteriaceae bacterium]
MKIVLLALLAICSAMAPGQQPAAKAPLAVPDIVIQKPKPYPFKFVVYGDMRFTEHDSYFIYHVANGAARQDIVNDIAKKDPVFVGITGDLVFRGFDLDDWKYFDKGIRPLRDADVRIFPALGNHEVGPYPSWLQRFYRGRNLVSAGLENYHKEFPGIPAARGWYSVEYANCYLLILDSHSGYGKGSLQREWMERQLDSLPAQIDYVLVLLHRPPHTAAPDAMHRARPQEEELAAALEARQKTLHARVLVIAGHVHNYERYEFNGVEYIVSGGGGAEPYKFTRGKDDLYRSQDPLTQDQYHYCLFTVDQAKDHAKLKFEMMRLNEKGKFDVRDKFEIDAWPGSATIKK